MGRRRRESRPVGGGGGEGGTRPVSLIPTQGASGLEKGHAEDCQDFPHLHNNNVDFHFFEYKNQKYFISSLKVNQAANPLLKMSHIPMLCCHNDCSSLMKIHTFMQLTQQNIKACDTGSFEHLLSHPAGDPGPIR